MTTNSIKDKKNKKKKLESSDLGNKYFSIWKFYFSNSGSYKEK